MYKILTVTIFKTVVGGGGGRSAKPNEDVRPNCPKIIHFFRFELEQIGQTSPAGRTLFTSSQNKSSNKIE